MLGNAGAVDVKPDRQPLGAVLGLDVEGLGVAACVRCKGWNGERQLAMASDFKSYACYPRLAWQAARMKTTIFLAPISPARCRLPAQSQAKLSAIATQLNERPRRSLRIQTPSPRGMQSALQGSVEPTTQYGYRLQTTHARNRRLCNRETSSL